MNLIICCTCLQALIIEKILDFYSDDKFILIMFTTGDNDKNVFYFKKLKKRMHYSFLITLNQTSISTNKLYYIYLILRNLFCIQKEIKVLKNYGVFDKVFLSYIHDVNMHLILDRIPYREVYSFDDGLANIVRSSFLYQENNSWKKKIFYKLFGIKCNYSLIKSNLKLHYTIYPSYDNIIDNIRFVNLYKLKFDECKTISSHFNLDSEKQIKILIGQFVFFDERDISLTQSVIDTYNIDYFIPSPREKYKFVSVNTVDTNLVFEDYFMQNWYNKPCIIYTFFSSAAFNLFNLNLNNVQFVSLKPTSLDNPSFLEVYSLLQKSGFDVQSYNF